MASGGYRNVFSESRVVPRYFYSTAGSTVAWVMTQWFFGSGSGGGGSVVVVSGASILDGVTLISPDGKNYEISNALLTGNSSGLFSAIKIINSLSELIASGFITPDGRLSIPGEVIFSSYGLLLATATVFTAPVSGQVTLFGTSDIVSLAIKIINGNVITKGESELLLQTLSYILGTAFLYGNSNTQLSAINLVRGFSELIGNGFLEITGRNSLISRIELSGFSELVLNGKNFIFSNSSLDGQAYILTSQYVISRAIANLYANGDVISNAVLSIPASATLDGLGYIIATAFIQGLVTGEVALFGSMDLISNSFLRIFGNELLSGSGDVVSSAIKQIFANSNLDGVSDVIFNGYKINVSQAALIASSENNFNAILNVLAHSPLVGLAFLIASGVIVSPIVTISGEAVLYGRNDLILSALNIINGQSLQTNDSVLSAISLVNVLSDSILGGFADTDANAVLVMSAIASLAASGHLVPIGTIPEPLLSLITPLKRTFIIPAENRIYFVDADGRVFLINRENRRFGIDYEFKRDNIDFEDRKYDIED